MKMRSTYTAAGAIIVLLGGGAYYLFMPKTPGVPMGGQPALPAETIMVGSSSIQAEIASTDAARMSGLSGRASLPDGTGMLFVFPKDGNWGIWMPDMRFPIDIAWADVTGKVVALDANIAPDTYPTVFYPNTDARYVLELPAGYAKMHSITVGSAMSLPKT